MTELTELQNKFIEAIKKNPSLKNKEYAELLSTTPGGIGSMIIKLRKKGVLAQASGNMRDGLHLAEGQQEDKPSFLGDLTKRKEAAWKKDMEAKYRALLGEYEMSEKRFDALLNIKEQVDITRIEPLAASSKDESIPIIQLSDWHFEERVDPATINGMNEYNLDIASYRWTKCIQNSLKLVHKERHSSEIKQMCLWLGGDFITGYIHEELEESNYLSPTQATRFAKEKIITAIKFYLEYGKFDRIVIPCNFGNHGRTNKKPRVSTGYKNSYEWMMYNDIADYFSDNKKVQFIIPSGMFAYVDLMGYTIRFFHGDSIGYGGGIGGLTIPLIKALQRYDQQQHAYYNFMGHFHQLWQATKNCRVNGSGIGYGPYAQRIGASPEDPRQGFNLLDKRYGMTTQMEIYCK